MQNSKIFDLCIVGSGPAGAFLAYELAKSKKMKIAIIESGNDNIDMNPYNFIDLSSSNIKGKLDFGFSRQVGGASNLWAGGLAKYDEIDLYPRDDFDLPGWPIDIDELNRYYKRVDEYLGIRPSVSSLDEESLGSSKFKSALEPREMRVLDTPFKTRSLVENTPGITLLKNCTGVQLHFKSEEHNNIENLEIFDHSTKINKSIHAKVFVIAAGTISNIRLLLNSFSILPSNKLTCSKNIGCYLSTHPKVDLGTLELFSPLNINNKLIIRLKENGFVSRYQFGLSSDLLLENKLLNHCIRFDSVIINRATRMFDKLKAVIGLTPFVKYKNNQLSKFLVESSIVFFRFLETTKGLGTIKDKLTLRGYFDQTPRAENRIKLSSQVLEDGLPLANISWKFSEDDWKNVDTFMKKFSNELKAEGIGELKYKRPNAEKLTSIHSHFIGGTRMGRDAESSVVDQNLKIHEIKNLFVSGPSVFPSYGYANPFYTIAALSLRLADHMKSKV